MRNVVLARVDDRLIHGQVVSGWIPAYSINHLIIIDDEIARNKLTKRVLKASAPSSVQFHIYSTSQAAEILQKPIEDKKEKIMILTKTPLVFLRLAELGCIFSAINLGGMGMYEGREPYFRNISCTKEEANAFCELKELGTDLFYQLVPEQKRFEAEEFMK